MIRGWPASVCSPLQAPMSRELQGAQIRRDNASRATGGLPGTIGTAALITVRLSPRKDGRGRTSDQEPR